MTPPHPPTTTALKVLDHILKIPVIVSSISFPSVVFDLPCLTLYLHRTLRALVRMKKSLLRGSREAPLERQEVENFMIPHQTPGPSSFLRHYLHPTCFLGPTRPYLLSLAQPTIKRVSSHWRTNHREKRPGPTIAHNIPALSRN